MGDAIRYRTMPAEELRKTFLIDDLFHPGKIALTYVDVDRTVIGSTVPTHPQPIYTGSLTLPHSDAPLTRDLQILKMTPEVQQSSNE